MIKQIRLEINDNKEVVASMNSVKLFSVSISDKTIDIESLYKKLEISKDDKIENCIENIERENKTTIEIIYDNVKMFLDELIKEINSVLTNFH